MNPTVVSVALLIGAIIGFILATDLHGLAWMRLIRMQRLTSECQASADKTQREYLTKLAEVIEEKSELTAEWKNVNAKLQDAVAIREKAKEQLQAALEIREREEKAR